jgi:hypothetical protein
MGAFLGRDKSEDMIESKLERHSGKRIIRGTVIYREPLARNNEIV